MLDIVHVTSYLLWTLRLYLLLIHNKCELPSTMQFFIVLSAIVAVCVADMYNPCAGCDYNIYGVGYAPTDCCNKFLKCQLLPGGGFQHIALCCHDGLVWDQYLLTCVPGDCYGEDYCEDCPEIVDPEGNTCYLLPHKDEHMFNMIVDGALQEMHCAPGTHFDMENCTCVHGGLTTCHDDPMLYFPFATHDNDIQCMHAEGISYGNAHVDQGLGALCVDGDGDYVEVPFLANWFNGHLGSFTVSLWFNQRLSSFENEDLQGLFSNSDCNNDPTVFLTVEVTLTFGGVTTTFGTETIGAEAYSPSQWHQMAVRYEPGTPAVSFFFNGGWVATENLSGSLMNSHAPATIGLHVVGNNEYYFNGCIDDVMVFDRYVDNFEIEYGVFSRDRTNGTTETPYTY